MSTAPKVSVLIPAYNYAHYLDETIQSVLSQTFTDFELIVVDNCSTDNTKEVVSKYLNDKRIHFHQNEKNLGLVGNWNKCLELANGTYIKMLCADDKLHPQMLERFVPVMEQNENLALIASYNQLFGGRNQIRKQPYTGLIKGRFAKDTLIKNGAKNWLNNPSVVMFRKSACDAVGRFNTQLLNMTDKEYYVRLLSIGDCYVIPEVLSYIRSHGGSQSSALRKKSYDQAFDTYRFFASVKAASAETNAELDETIKKRALNCSVLVYKLLPNLYKRENRKYFKTAFKIGYTEGVLLKPLIDYIKWDNVKKLFAAKAAL